MTLLAIDPGRSFKGEKSIGYAIFTQVGAEIARGSLSWEELCARLIPLAPRAEVLVFDAPAIRRSMMVHEIVIEDFVNDPKSARGGQRNGTSECIGAVEILAVQAGVPFTRQKSDILYAAKLHAPEGSYKKLKHLRHEDSAFLHGYEFLVRRGDIEVDLSSTM